MSPMLKFLALFLATSVFIACSPDKEPVVDSNSNWLVACNEDAPCGSKFTCECGYCSTECMSDDDCTIDGSVCVLRDTYRSHIVCGVQQLTRGTCVAECEQARDCPNRYACARNVCVDVSQTCATADYEYSDEESEARVEIGFRMQQGFCGGMQMHELVPSRAACVGRITALDMHAEDFTTLPDPEGFDLQDRLVWMDSAASFTFGKAYTVTDAPDAVSLVDVLEADMEFCDAFNDPDAQAFWVSRSESIWFVMVLAP